MVEGDPVEWTFYGDIDWMGGDIVDNVIIQEKRVVLYMNMVMYQPI